MIRSVRNEKMAFVLDLTSSLESIAERKGIKAIVRHKVNAAGALVIALIIPETRPREWTHTPPPGPLDRPPKHKIREPRY